MASCACCIHATIEATLYSARLWCKQHDKPVGLEITMGTGHYDTEHARAAYARDDAAQAARAESCSFYFPDVITIETTRTQS